MSNKNVFSVKVDDKEVQDSKGGSYGKFGLNTGFITTMSYVEDKNKSGEAYKAISIVAKINEGEYRKMIFLSPEVYETGKEFGTAKLLSPGMEGYEEAFYAHYVGDIAVIKQILHAFGITNETIDKNLEGASMENFLDGIKKLVSLAPENYDKLPVDIFLEYEWAIREGQKKTYPVLPKNLKGGYFIVKHEEGTWTEVRDAEGLHYVNESGTKHTFVRTANFMTSNKGVQQTLQPVIAPTLPTNNQSSAW